MTSMRSGKGLVLFSLRQQQQRQPWRMTMTKNKRWLGGARRGIRRRPMTAGATASKKAPEQHDTPTTTMIVSAPRNSSTFATLAEQVQPTATTTNAPFGVISQASAASSSPPTVSEASKWINAPRSKGRNDDALSRYPYLGSAGGILRGLDYAGTLTFALTGSITAAQSGLDVFGCSMVAMVTAVGGGTIRDAVFLSRKPFWTSETEYIWMSVLTGLTAFFTWPWVLEHKQKLQQQQQQQVGNGTDSSSSYDTIDGLLDTLDAVGLSAFAIIGAQNGVRAGMPMVVSAICGMSTSTFGGLMRDVLCARPVRIVHSNAEVYAAPALAGAVTYLVTRKYFFAAAGGPFVWIGSAFMVCMGSRFLAVQNDWKLHTWDTQRDGRGVAVRK